MLDFAGSTSDKDLPDVISFPVGKNVMSARRNPMHYGFWTIHFEKGAVPENLRGQYTSRKIAEQAIKAYIQGREKNPPPKE